MSASYSSCYIMGNIGRIGSILYASMGWTNSQTPSLSVTPYRLIDTSLVDSSDVLKNQVAYINLAEFPFNITDSLFIYFKLVAGGTTLFDTPLFGPSFVYDTGSSVIRRMAYVNFSKTLSDLQTALGGAAHANSLTYEIRFAYPTGARMYNASALVMESGTVEYSKSWSFTAAMIGPQTAVTAGTNCPIAASNGTQTLTETDTLTPHLATKFSSFLTGYSQLKTDASSAALGASSIYSIVNDATIGNSAIKTSAAAAASSAANAESDAALTRLWVTDGDTGLHAIAADAASAKTSGIATVNTVSNATYGNQAIKNAVDNAVSYSSAASSAVTDANYGNSAIKTALNSVASDVSAATTAVTNVDWGTSAIKQDTASILSAVSDASSGLTAISADIGTVTDALGSPYGDSIADDIASVSSSVATVSSVIGTPVGDSLAADIAAVAADVSGNSDQISACSSRVNALVHAVEKNTAEIHQFKRETKK